MVLLPPLLIQVDAPLKAAAAVAHQAIGDPQQVRPGVALFAIPRSGLPRATKNFLAQIVGHVWPANHRQQEAAHGLAVFADPICKQLLIARAAVSIGHAYYSKRGKLPFIAAGRISQKENAMTSV